MANLVEKTIVGVWLLSALGSLAVVLGLVFIVIHFIAKAW